MSATIIFAPIGGTIKIAMGALQMLGAAFLLICSSFGEDPTLAKHAWIHIKHGAGNVIVGIGEFMPIIATCIFFDRVSRIPLCGKGIDMEVYITNDGKYMPYESVMKRKLHIISGDRANEYKNAVGEFNKLYPDVQSRDIASLKTMLKNAKDIGSVQK